MAWLTGLFTDPNTAPAAYGLIVLLLILIAVFVFSRMRHARRGMFVAGGRKHRLAVVDATAVDNRRRLVLVRRDSVEHLLLIGGHNDLVVEDGIAVDTAEGHQTEARSAAPPPVAEARPQAKQPESPPIAAAPQPPRAEVPAPVVAAPVVAPKPVSDSPPPVEAPGAAATPGEDATLTIEAEMERLLGGLVDPKDDKR